MSTVPESQASISSTLAELNLLLDGVKLFGRDWQIDELLTFFDLPVMHPCTALLDGAPESGKSRFISSFPGLFAGQAISIAEFYCSPTKQMLPYGMLIPLLSSFLATHSTEWIEQQVGPVVHAHPWLARLFPRFRQVTPASPPTDPAQLKHGLESVFLGMMQAMPHVAIIHDLQYADEESIATLKRAQEAPRLGLRLLATVDIGDDLPPPNLWQFMSALEITEPTLLPPLTGEQLTEYLEDMSPDFTNPAMRAELCDTTGCHPLAIEVQMRRWVIEERLRLRGETWEFDESPSDAAPVVADSMLYERLGQAALVGPTAATFLARLWDTTMASARGTIEQGRLLGHLRPANPLAPDAVEFTDRDHLAYLAHKLDADQQMEAHSVIARLLVDTTAEHPFETAYHLMQSGQADEAEKILTSAMKNISTYLPVQAIPYDRSLERLQRWDIPPPTPVPDEQLPFLVDAVMGIRLAGVQYRLYPPHGERVRECLNVAVEALERYLAIRPSLTITYNGESVAYEGKERGWGADIGIASRDFVGWMEWGGLYAIGIARGVSRVELSHFLRAMSTQPDLEDSRPLLVRVASLNLSCIRVYSRLPKANELRALDPGGEDKGGRLCPHGALLSLLASGIDPTDAPVYEEGSVVSESGMPAHGGDAPSAPKHHDESFVVSADNWHELPDRLEHAPAHARDLLIVSLSRWLDTDDMQDPANIPDGLDALIRRRLRIEEDSVPLTDTIAIAGKRLALMRQYGLWDDIIPYLEAIAKRLAAGMEPYTHQLLDTLLDEFGGSKEFQQWLNGAVNEEDQAERVQSFLRLLNEHLIRPLLQRLEEEPSMQERGMLVSILQKVCKGHQQLLLLELREAHPWYFYRNVLQIIAAVGTEEALAVVGEKLTYADTRVRVEALAAASTIAGANAVPYLLKAFTDPEPEVRARAISMTRGCVNGRLLRPLLNFLRRTPIGFVEPERVVIATCFALGHFPDAEAREALLGVLFPKVWFSRAGQNELVRSAALTALEEHSDHPSVRQAVQRAIRDKNNAVRYVAQRIWDKLQRQGGAT